MLAAASDRVQPALSWSSRQHWWTLVLEGVALLIFGFSLDVIFVSEGDVGRFVAALVVLEASMRQVVAGYQLQDESTSDWKILLGGIAALATGPALLSPWVLAIPLDTAWKVLALGLIAYGILGLMPLIITAQMRGRQHVAMRALLFALLPLVLGTVILALVNPEELGAEFNWASGAVGLGIVLLGEGFSRWRKTRSTP